jgi:hypothetical protein
VARLVRLSAEMCGNKVMYIKKQGKKLKREREGKKLP